VTTKPKKHICSHFENFFGKLVKYSPKQKKHGTQEQFFLLTIFWNLARLKKKKKRVQKVERIIF
jgi:hypothetical protein